MVPLYHQFSWLKHQFWWLNIRIPNSQARWNSLKHPHSHMFTIFFHMFHICLIFHIFPSLNINMCPIVFQWVLGCIASFVYLHLPRLTCELEQMTSGQQCCSAAVPCAGTRSTALAKRSAPYVYIVLILACICMCINVCIYIYILHNYIYIFTCAEAVLLFNFQHVYVHIIYTYAY